MSQRYNNGYYKAKPKSSAKKKKPKAKNYDSKQGWIDVWHQITGSSGKRQNKKIDDTIDGALGKKKKKK